MKIKPFFSIITITYNDFENLLDTYHSIYEQVYTNFEWIVIDGKSEDNTLEFLKKADRRPDILISEPDNGIYDAMNKGLYYANGKYIIFLNSGDKLSNKSILQYIYSFVKNLFYEPDFIYGDSIEQFENKSIVYRRARSSSKIWLGMFTHHQAMFYKKDIIFNNNLKFRTDLKIASDYYFTAEYLGFCDKNKILYINKPICIFKKDGISSKLWKTSIKEQNIVRYEVLKMNKILIYALNLLQYYWHFLKEKFPLIYNLRVKKIKSFTK